MWHHGVYWKFYLSNIPASPSPTPSEKRGPQARFCGGQGCGRRPLTQKLTIAGTLLGAHDHPGEALRVFKLSPPLDRPCHSRPAPQPPREAGKGIQEGLAHKTWSFKFCLVWLTASENLLWGGSKIAISVPKAPAEPSLSQRWR